MSEIATPASGNLFTPIALDPAAPVAGLWGIARATRTNALNMWPRAAYQQEVFVQSELRKPRFLLNGEAGIHRVLVANARNYKRTPATIRVLYPITGEGLLLSEGETWRRQRQTVAPALAPRVMPLLAHHVVAATERTLGTIEPGAVDALALMQTLTLDVVASRSMFSVEMDDHGATLRQMIRRYGEKLGRPTLLDLMLPPAIPTPRDPVAHGVPAALAAVDGPDHGRSAGYAGGCASPRSVRPPAAGPQSRDGGGVHPAAAARPDGDADPGGARDDGADAVLGAVSDRQRARRAGAVGGRGAGDQIRPGCRIARC